MYMYLTSYFTPTIFKTIQKYHQHSAVATVAAAAVVDVRIVEMVVVVAADFLML